jgi:hypothetical protein
MEENLTQSRKGKREIRNSRKKAQNAQKGGLEIWQTDLHCGAMDRWLPHYRCLTIQFF